MVSYDVGKGKLWLDGSGRVSVPMTVNTQLGQIRFKMIMLPADKIADFWLRFKATRADERVLAPIPIHDGFYVADSLDEKFAMRVLDSADKARQDPKQAMALAESKKRAIKGAEKSRTALKKRILSKKEIAFKTSVQDLLDRGVTKAQLYQLVRDAIVEGVHLT